jgi:putative methionine-R-sulfoxide reductase with GAF domain
VSNISEYKNDSPEQTLAGFRRLHQVFYDIVSEQSHSNRQALMCEYLKELIQVNSVGLYLLDSGTGRFRFHRGTAEIDAKYSGGFLEVSEEALPPVEEKIPLMIVTSSEILLRTENTTFDFKDRFLCLLPVRAHSMIKGIFMGEHHEMPNVGDSWRAEPIKAFLTDASLLVEFFLEYQGMEEKNKALRLLYEISDSLNTIRDEDKLLESILMLLEKHMQVERCSLMIVQPDGRTMKIKNAFGMPNVDIGKIKVTIGEGIAGFVAASARPLLIRNIETEPHLRSNVKNKKVFRTNSLLSVPLVAGGKVIGVINVNNRKDGLCFSEADRDLLNTIGSEIAAVLERSYMELQLKKARELDRDIQRYSV